jgi:hypothetical protein
MGQYTSSAAALDGNARIATMNSYVSALTGLALLCAMGVPTPVPAQPVSISQPLQGPVVARGGQYMGFVERFNRYYTDPAWRAPATIFVSPRGAGDGRSPATAAAVTSAIAAAHPGTRIVFTRGAYRGCYELPKANSGTYDAPVVLYGERNVDGSLGVTIDCCDSGRRSCFNLEHADYVAIDGFSMSGGRYGVRSVGEGYAASQHARGLAVLNSRARSQSHDGFFTGAVDWAVFERNVAHGAGKGDGHGIYISNGSDWNIVRFNETFSNHSSDFQINADPASTCKEVGIAFDDPRCDAFAGTGEGGQGASDYFLVDGNHFHHGDGPGPNFTSVRRSIVRNNVFGPQARHNVSFWQETENPRLGSSENRILHNLFITTGRHGVQFANHSTRNEFINNVIVAVRDADGSATGNPTAVLMAVDGTVAANVYRANLYIAGRLDGRAVQGQEVRRPDFSASWFQGFPLAIHHDPGIYRPTRSAPFLGLGQPSPFAPRDRDGGVRAGAADLGPFSVR